MFRHVIGVILQVLPGMRPRSFYLQQGLVVN